MKYINKIIDGLYDIFEYLLLAIILILAVLVIIWRYMVMYDQSLVQLKESQNTESVGEHVGNDDLQGNVVKIIIPQGTDEKGILNILSQYGIEDPNNIILKNLKNLPDEELPNGSFEITLGSSAEEVLDDLNIQ